mmetsp:Transcript_49934/g.141508  ORF Transcript_49934/g.141508 Transcript_49934/m.141508 type:complete len:292 (-) Transcript_49934:2-877(-)
MHSARKVAPSASIDLRRFAAMPATPRQPRRASSPQLWRAPAPGMRRLGPTCNLSPGLARTSTATRRAWAPSRPPASDASKGCGTRARPRLHKPHPTLPLPLPSAKPPLPPRSLGRHPKTKPTHQISETQTRRPRPTRIQGGAGLASLRPHPNWPHRRERSRREEWCQWWPCRRCNSSGGSPAGPAPSWQRRPAETWTRRCPRARPERWTNRCRSLRHRPRRRPSSEARWPQLRRRRRRPARRPTRSRRRPLVSRPPWMAPGRRARRRRWTRSAHVRQRREETRLEPSLPEP